MVKPPDHKTTTSFKTSLAANATYNLVKPDLTCYLSIIKARPDPCSNSQLLGCKSQCLPPCSQQYVE